ncbi:DUF2063 domain-containing protein [Dechloromonas sp.]|uniref:HvfC family RiPP maturation protein n=1 Tax=Dechloromonas sp. TaxID=1917218 RepID=UPI0011F45D07|nr:putative DNA-binding domain-containing protein [Dechloromonas sp.]MBU3695468.1 DUF2063 domain-containing protein [Dechloromonas sp.]TEX48988.1 MAG: DUF2063 domain-containing protein [Rhodocyclaceae bacterium]
MALAFQQFQRDFGRHLRNPHHAPRPAGLPARRVAAYNELLFNNICGFLDACFPVCRELLGESRWRRLNRTFYRDWPLHTPWFREIPREFVRYLADADIATARPRWLAELAHYEWAELAVDIMDAPLPEHDPTGDLMLGRPVLNPARLDLSYNWPVHRIGTDYRPQRPQATQLVVYRDADLAVQFTEINPVTAHLLALLVPGQLTGEAALTQIATALQHPDPAQVLAFGRDLLNDLHRQGIILGSA